MSLVDLCYVPHPLWVNSLKVSCAPLFLPLSGVVRALGCLWFVVLLLLGHRRSSASPSFIDERYEVLRILDFTSARKRMSVIVRDPEG